MLQASAAADNTRLPLFFTFLDSHI